MWSYNYKASHQNKYINISFPIIRIDSHRKNKK